MKNKKPIFQMGKLKIYRKPGWAVVILLVLVFGFWLVFTDLETGSALHLLIWYLISPGQAKYDFPSVPPKGSDG